MCLYLHIIAENVILYRNNCPRTRVALLNRACKIWLKICPVAFLNTNRNTIIIQCLLKTLPKTVPCSIFSYSYSENVDYLILNQPADELKSIHLISKLKPKKPYLWSYFIDKTRVLWLHARGQTLVWMKFIFLAINFHGEEQDKVDSIPKWDTN